MKDYWVVINKATGKVICHCGEEQDAIRMIIFDSNRIYRKQKFIMEQVINVSSSGIKELPGQQGLPPVRVSLKDFESYHSLPEGNQEPVNID